MQLKDHVWFISCDDPDLYKVLARRLDDLKQGIENEVHDSFVCPDGVIRPTLEVPYEMVIETSSFRKGSSWNRFRLMTKKTPNSKVEFWPPNSNGTTRGIVRPSKNKIMKGSDLPSKKPKKDKERPLF